MALISVIVPVYMTESLLRRCVDSILAQSFTDFELILVDDGSPDRCGEICDDYTQKDARVQVIHQSNAGQASAKDAGIEKAYANKNTQWLTFIDSDDWVHPEYLERLYKAAITFGAKIAACGMEEVYGTSPVPLSDDFSVERFTPEEFWVKERLLATVPVCKLIHKSVFKAFRFPAGKVHEDEFIMYRPLFACETIAYINTQMYFYYQNPNGITLQKKWTPARADSLEAFCEQCDFFHKNGFFQAEIVSAKALFLGCSEVLHHLLKSFPSEKKMIRKIRALLRHVWRKYNTALSYEMIGSKNNYDRLAHPIKTKIRIKWKHALILLRRILHA